MLKYSRSIMIFTCVSISLSAYLYAFKKTEGNILKSLRFTLYFLSIKIGLIAYNDHQQLDQNQSPHQICKHETGIIYFHPYVSILDKSRSYVLEMENIKEPILQASLKTSSVINEIRAGDLASDLREAAVLLATIWLLIQEQTNAFQPAGYNAPPPPHHQLFGGTSRPPSPNNLPKSGGTTSFSAKPLDMSQEEYKALTAEQRRNLPDSRDGFIYEDVHADLVTRFGQVKHKTPQHGGMFGIPTKKNGKVKNTDENAMVILDGVLALANHEDVQRYENGMYQGGTERGYESVILYSPELNRLAVFKKGPDGEYHLWSTICEPTDDERTFFEESNGNFVTQRNLNNPKILPILIKLPNPKK